MTKDKKITKADALKMCEGCKKRDSKKCVYSDIEGSREEEITVPKCMYEVQDVEIWRDIKGYEGHYEVSNKGHVKTHKGKKGARLLSEKYMGKGYFGVSLSKKGVVKAVRIHRLVAESFLLNPENKKTINHKDGNKNNNRVDNLEFMTNAENMEHALETGLKERPLGSKNPHAKLNESDIPVIRELCKTTDMEVVAKKYGVKKTAINKIVQGISWKHVGKNGEFLNTKLNTTLNTNDKVYENNEKNSYTQQNLNTKNANDYEESQKLSRGNEELGTAQGYQPNSCTLKLTNLDEEIITLLKDQYHLRGIAKELNHPPSTISYRLKRLKKAGLIRSYNGAYGTKLYKLSSNLNTPHDQTLVYDDNRQQSAHSFTAHSMTFKFPLTSGIQPKSSHPFNMKNWTGYTFHYNDHEIRSTTKSIIIDINQDLGAGSIDDLNLKYAEIAQAHAQNFAKQHNLTLGTPQRYRKPHFTIPDTAIGQILSERGTFKTKGMDLSIDESKSKGDLEMGEESARAFEFTLNKLPDIANKIETRMGELNETTIDEFSKTTDRFDKVDKGITNLHVLIQMKHENDKLREDLKETLKLVQDQIGMQTPATETPTDDKINRNHIMQIYG